MPRRRRRSPPKGSRTCGRRWSPGCSRSSTRRSSARWSSCATTDESTLTDARGVGRAQLPSTVIGLLFHAAEHTQRHMGQLMTTAKIVASAG